MVFWLTAAAVGVAAAGLQYGRPSGMGWLAALLRVLSVALLVALCLDAPAGRGSQPRALAALDVSASWRRGQDSAAYRTALAELGRASGDSVLLIGDSLRAGPPPAIPRDARSRVRPAVERALATGRPLTLITDGEIDDPEALTELPAGSRVVVVAHPPSRDAGLTALDAPRAAVAGDTIELRATLVAGPGGSGAGHLAFSVGSSPPAPASIIAADPLPKGAERSVIARVPVPAGDGPRVLRAVWTGDGDTEVRDDTLSAAIDVSPAAGAVFVSTSPDEDARYALSVLRDALTLPTRGFFRVAPGQWRVDGTLDHVTEADVRQAVAAAPVVVLDGDTAVFGAPRAASRGSLALLAPPAPTSDEEWYATGAPPSPVAAALGGVAWDSLPPIDVAPENALGDWQGLEAKRGRRYDRRVVVAGSTTDGRRVVTVNAGGLWRWRFRGGASADAYTALWGGIFDWLAAERRDQRAAVPADALVREGDPIRWRRGSGPDTSVTVVLTVRGGSGPPDSLRLRFPPGAATTETAPLAAGVYDVRTTGGPALLVVNASREWLPRAPSVRTGHVGGVVLAGAAPRLRALGWIYLLLVAALCAEWLWRGVPDFGDMGRLFQRPTDGPRRTLWQRIKDLALTDVAVAVRGLDEVSLERLEEMLLEADFGVATTSRLVATVERDAREGVLRTRDELLRALQGGVESALRSGASDPALRVAAEGPTVIVVIGINGAGKTTFIGKLAARMRHEGHRVLVAAGDTFRAGAVDQLRVWAGRSGSQFISGATGRDPAAVAVDALEAAAASGADVVLIDTAGRLHTSGALMDELKKIIRVIAKRCPGAPHEILLVLDATIGQNAIAQGQTFSAAVPVSGLVVTKVDGTAKGGVVVAVHEALNVPIKFIGTGETADDLVPFDAAEFARELLET